MNNVGTPKQTKAAVRRLFVFRTQALPEVPAGERQNYLDFAGVGLLIFATPARETLRLSG